DRRHSRVASAISKIVRAFNLRNGPRGALHRGRGDAENLIRGAKQTGLENLPFREFALNAVWLELSLIAQDLIAWTQRLCLTGELAICEPRALRYRNADLVVMPTLGRNLPQIGVIARARSA